MMTRTTFAGTDVVREKRSFFEHAGIANINKASHRMLNPFSTHGRTALASTGKIYTRNTLIRIIDLFAIL